MRGCFINSNVTVNSPRELEIFLILLTSGGDLDFGICSHAKNAQQCRHNYHNSVSLIMTVGIVRN